MIMKNLPDDLESMLVKVVFPKGKQEFMKKLLRQANRKLPMEYEIDEEYSEATRNVKQREYRSHIVGKTITKVRKMTKQEMENEGWHTPGIVIELDDDTIIYPYADYKGNKPGVMFGTDGTPEGGFLLLC